jgi:hypothetical protein
MYRVALSGSDKVATLNVSPNISTTCEFRGAAPRNLEAQ